MVYSRLAYGYGDSTILAWKRTKIQIEPGSGPVVVVDGVFVTCLDGRGPWIAATSSLPGSCSAHIALKLLFRKQSDF